MRLIGQRWKSGNVSSLLILIGRGLDLRERLRKAGQRRDLRKVRKELRAKEKRKSLCGFEDAKDILRRFSVAIAGGVHLFPSRTQKLSLRTLMVLGWQRPGRVGRRRNQEESGGDRENGFLRDRLNKKTNIPQ